MTVYKVAAQRTEEDVFYVEADDRAEAFEAAVDLAFIESGYYVDDEIEIEEPDAVEDGYSIWRGGEQGHWSVTGDNDVS